MFVFNFFYFLAQFLSYASATQPSDHDAAEALKGARHLETV